SDRTLLQTILLFAGAAAAGYLFDLAHVPMGWMLGPMAAGIAWVFRTGRPMQMWSGYTALGQAVFGISTGAGFPLATLLMAASHGAPLILAVVITGGLALLNGYFLWKWAGIDRATGFMGSLPGAANTMVAMADEMGADAVVVAVLQYWRLILVMFVAPLAVHALFPAPAAAGAASSVAAAGAGAGVHWAVNLLVLAACGVAGAWLGRLVKLPSPTFLGPFLTMLLVAWTTPYHWVMPPWLFKGAMLLVGVTIGVRFDVATAKRLGKAALIETGLVLALIGICLGVGYGFHLVTGVGTMTSVLGSTPGAMDVMVASAYELGADPGMVLAMQLTRWFLILMAGPWVTVRLVQVRKTA
ncbi:MAG TPA: AbrB family transcriptional regulator, partial [Symbiobacteriaceae bacterium]|nr:AbrB family transcriptional regulator [Symbiobacteriaceae bacterium]